MAKQKMTKLEKQQAKQKAKREKELARQVIQAEKYVTKQRGQRKGFKYSGVLYNPAPVHPTRICLVTDGDNAYHAAFHRFERTPEIRGVAIVEANGEHKYEDVVISRVVAVVERFDGKVVVVDVDAIKFIDNYVKQQFGGDQ